MLDCHGDLLFLSLPFVFIKKDTSSVNAGGYRRNGFTDTVSCLLFKQSTDTTHAVNKVCHMHKADVRLENDSGVLQH